MALAKESGQIEEEAVALPLKELGGGGRELRKSLEVEETLLFKFSHSRKNR